MKKLMYCGVVFASLFGTVCASFAHQGATGVVKTRMMAMKDLGGLMKRLVKLDWGDSQSARGEAGRVAGEVIIHSREMQKLFPAGSNKKPSEAMDNIWQDEAGFTEAIHALEVAAKSLQSVAPRLQSAGDLKPQIKMLGAACSACHKDYRQKKN